MHKPEFRYLSHPKLVQPILVEGLPGFGNVGKIAAQLLIESTRATCFSELYSPYFPDYAVIAEDGLCHLPRCEFYESSTSSPSFLILTGDSQPSLEDTVAHYQFCGEVLNFAEKHGCRFVVTMGGVPVSHPKSKIYVSATSEKLAGQIMARAPSNNATIYGGGRIIGATGLLLGLAKERGLEGLCLLGATTGHQADRNAALVVFNYLLQLRNLLRNPPSQ